MKHETKTKLCLLSLLAYFVCSTAQSPGAAKTESPKFTGVSREEIDAKARREKLDQRLKTLVSKRRMDEALTVAGTDTYKVQKFAYEEIQRAKKTSRGGEVLLSYRAYFEAFPFNSQITIPDTFHLWDPLAFDYVARIKTGGHRELAYEIEAARIYRSIQNTRQNEKNETKRIALSRRMATDMLKKCPRSIFVAMAVREAVWEASNLDDAAAFMRIFEDFLKRVSAPVVPMRTRVLTYAFYADHLRADDDNLNSQRKAIAAYRSIATWSSFEIEKRSAMLSAAETARWFWRSDPKMLELSRALFDAIVKSAPDSTEAEKARVGLIDYYVFGKQPQKALSMVRDYEKQRPAATDLSALYWRITQSTDDAARGPLLKKIVQRFPNTEAGYNALLAVGQELHSLGKTDEEAEIYRKIAAQTVAPNGLAGLAFSRARSYSVAFLAREAEEKKDWANALKWWREWNSSSTCGNGAASANSVNALRIYNCLMHLNRPAEAVLELENSVLPSSLECSAQTMAALVEHHHTRGTLPRFRDRLRAALQKNPNSVGAGMAQEYLALYQAAQEGNAGRLWLPFLQRSHSGLEYLNWREKLAGRLLAESGETGRLFLLQQARAAPTSTDEVLWSCLLLARMQAPETVTLVSELWGAPRMRWQKKHLALALALEGSPQARALLKTYADEKNGDDAAKILSAYPTREDVKFLEGDNLMQHGDPFDASPLWKIKSTP